MLDVRGIGVRIRRLRLATGIDQSELGKLSGIDQQGAISRIENGRAHIGDELLGALASALDCSPAFLTEPGKTVPASRPWLRAYADAPKRTVDQQLAQCSLVAEFIDRLNLSTLPDIIPLFDDQLNDDEAIEEFALEVREAADIPEGAVVGHATRAAERLGCVVLPMSMELGRHLGMSTYADLRPMICVSRPLSNPDHLVPGDRQRFTVAHELGHLALHRELPPPQSAEEARRIERQAHRFAGAFLAPSDALMDDLRDVGGRVTLRTLARLKERWGVAIKALVVRFRQLGIIDDAHARSLHKQISSRKWNKVEPVTVENEEAIWLAKAIAKAKRAHPDPLAAAAADSGLGRSHLERWVDWTPVETDRATAEVIDLPQRARATLGLAQNSAGVTRLPVGRRT